MVRCLNKEYLKALSCRKYVFRPGSRFARLVKFGEISVLFSFSACHRWRLVRGRAVYTDFASFPFDRVGADTNILHSVPVLDILTVNRSTSFLDVIFRHVGVAQLYHIYEYSMKSVWMFVFQEASTTHGGMSESRSLAMFLGKN